MRNPDNFPDIFDVKNTGFFMHEIRITRRRRGKKGAKRDEKRIRQPSGPVSFFRAICLFYAVFTLFCQIVKFNYVNLRNNYKSQYLTGPRGKEGQKRGRTRKKPRNSSEASRGVSPYSSIYPIIETRARISSSLAFNFSVTWKYISRVVLLVVWPRRRAIVSRDTPCSANKETCVCLKMCGCKCF